MIKPKILVTGATGRTGRAVVTELLAKGWPVRAAVRVRDARGDLLQRRGAEVVVADMFDPGQLSGSFRCQSRARAVTPRPRSTILPALQSPRCSIHHVTPARATGRLGRSSSPLPKWPRSSAVLSATKCGT